MRGSKSVAIGVVTSALLLAAGCDRVGGSSSSSATPPAQPRSISATSGQTARLALVIGNDTYTHASQLTNARNDANLFASVLTEAGFEIVGGVREDLDRKAMWSALDEFQRRVSKGDDVVFYYAGHGVQIGSDALLLPVDIEPESDDQVIRDGVNLVGVQEELKKAKFALLVVDACRNNPFPPKSGTRGIGDSRGLVPVEAAEGNAILLAASRGQTALDYVPGITTHNGLFTYELVQAIRSPGADILTALRQVRDQIEDTAKAANHDQRPALMEEMRGTFVLFPASAVQQASRTVPRTQPPQGVVAVVNSTNITRTFYEYYVKRLSGKASTELTLEQRNTALDNLTRAEVAAQEVGNEGLDKTAKTAEELASASRKVLDDAAKQKMGPEETVSLLELARLETLERSLLYRYLADKQPTEAELRAEYEAQVLAMPNREYHARHILVATQPLAQQVINRLDGGAKFDALAKSMSLDSSKVNGGDIGWFNTSAVVPEFASALIALKPGEYTHAPVKTQFGWHVILLIATRDRAPPPFDQVRERIRNVVEGKRFRSYLDDLLKSAKVERYL